MAGIPPTAKLRATEVAVLSAYFALGFLGPDEPFPAREQVIPLVAGRLGVTRAEAAARVAALDDWSVLEAETYSRPA